MRSLCATVTVLAFVGLYVKAAKFPSSFQLCKKNDPDVDVCLKSAIEKALRVMAEGIPSLHVLPVDPLVISQLVVQGTPGRPVNFNIKLTDATLKGLRTAQVKKVVSDLDKVYVDIDLLIPLLELSGNYIMDGKFLVLPLKGEGKAIFKLHDARIKLIFRASTLKKNGDSFWNVLNFDVDISQTSRFETSLTNLFNGDESLAKSTLEALNSNWEAFWSELRPSIEESFSYIFKSISNDVLKRVPEKEMFPSSNE